MNAYTGFSSSYDLFMDNIPYDDWSRYLIELLKEYNIDNGIVLELGCGTGNITERLAKEGYDMIGIDNSYDMLDVAMEKKFDSELDILYLCQDMREFELYGTVAAIVSVCDSMNYITEYNDLVQVFKLANNYLDPDGLFIFDLNTRYKYMQIGDKTIAENREKASFIWENTFYEEENINEYELTIFQQIESDENSSTDTDDDTNIPLYEKYTETHYQRAYTLDEIKSALKDAGMSYITSYNAFTHDPVSEDNERIYVIAKENGKSGKDNA